MNLCINCKYSKGVTKDASWHSCYCKHPELKRVKEQDPVTGKMMYAAKNSLDEVYLTDEEYPHCNSINHGNCPYYKKKLW